MVVVFTHQGIPHKLELKPGSQMKLAANLHDMFCPKQCHELCQIKHWMIPAKRVIQTVLE